MGLISIKVDVGNVYPPKPIRVVIDNLENDDEITFKRSKSFEQEVNLPQGKYLITIFGVNQIDDTTSALVTGAFDPNDEQSSSDSNYVFIFIGETS